MMLRRSQVRPKVVATSVLTLACVGAGTAPMHRLEPTRRAARCEAVVIPQRACPSHPYQCIGELPEGLEIIGIIEANRDLPMSAFQETAAIEGGDLLVVGPFHQEPVRIGGPNVRQPHVYRRALVVRLPPLDGTTCQSIRAPQSDTKADRRGAARP